METSIVTFPDWSTLNPGWDMAVISNSDWACPVDRQWTIVPPRLFSAILIESGEENSESVTEMASNQRTGVHWWCCRSRKLL